MNSISSLTSLTNARTTFPMSIALASVLSLVLGTSLTACKEAPAPTATTAPAAAPTFKDGKLAFAADHPQLEFLKTVAAAAPHAMTVEMPARLVWNEERTERVYPAFAGRVVRMNADVGQPVKAGTVLAQLASPDFGVAQADTMKSLVDAKYTDKSLQRQKELYDAGVISRKDLEQAEADAQRARAESVRAEARTRLYGSASTGINQQLALTATVNGVVVERNLNPGQEVRPDQSGPGSSALFVVTDPTSLWVQIDARDSEIAALRPGSPFELSVPALAGQKFQGKVIAASDFIDPSTRTIKIRGVIANPERLLKAEMLATARFERTPSSGVVIPSSAVMLRNNQHLVYVRTAPGVFEEREVTVAIDGSREMIVSRGLQAGDLVVAQNNLLLSRQFRSAQDETKATQ